MNPVERLPIAWRASDRPLRPTAVAASGAAAVRLLRRALVRGVGGLAGVAGTDTVVLLGEEQELPWVEGVVYLGRHPEAAGLLLPTALCPTAPLDLLAAALRARVPAGELPVAVLPAGSGAPTSRLIPLGSARPLDPGVVDAWLRAHPG